MVDLCGYANCSFVCIIKWVLNSCRVYETLRKIGFKEIKNTTPKRIPLIETGERIKTVWVAGIIEII